MLLKPIRKKKQPKSEHPVSIHACERYAERVMDQGDMEDKLTFVQIEKLTELILKILNEEHSSHIYFQNGNFACKNHECILVKKGNVVVTVKLLTAEDPDMKFSDTEEYEDPHVYARRKAYRKGKQIFKQGYK